MRKLFSIFAATLLAASMFAQSTEKNPAPADVTQDQAVVGVSYTIPAAQVAGAGSKLVGDMWDKGVKVRTNKAYGEISNALPFVVNEGKQINSIKIVGISNADAALTFTSVIIDGTTQSLSGSLPNKSSSTSGTVEVKDIAAMESVVFITSGANQALICYEITYDDANPSTDPVLNVDKESVELNAVAANPAPKAEVTFSGKNLAAGNYTLVVPNLSGLYVEPASVTVGEDGKLNAKVVIRFAPTVEMEAASTKISLTIGELTKEVTIAYSASFDTNYEYGASVNIEQWVLDNGKDNQAFQAVLQAAHIDFENINELDSLNDAKTARNEPYLGLKLKKAGAFVGLWIKQGSAIRLKLGFVGDDVIVSANGEEATIKPDQWAQVDGKLEITNVPYDCYMKLTTTSDKTVVIKQIMIDEPIAEVTLPDSPTPSAIENTAVATKAAKRIVNGQVIIEMNGKFYNTLGTEIR